MILNWGGLRGWRKGLLEAQFQWNSLTPSQPQQGAGEEGRRQLRQAKSGAKPTSVFAAKKFFLLLVKRNKPWIECECCGIHCRFLIFDTYRNVTMKCWQEVSVCSQLHLELWDSIVETFGTYWPHESEWHSGYLQRPEAWNKMKGCSITSTDCFTSRVQNLLQGRWKYCTL
jgi:hypothetical protein